MTAGDERNREIARRYQAGETMAAVGAQFGISGEAVRQVLQRIGVPARKPSSKGRTLATPQQVAEILRRRATDESVLGIAQAVGLTYSVVRNVLIANGIDTRDRRHTNRPGVPRTCTICWRTEAEGATFSPGGPFNRCAACAAAWQREYRRKRRAVEAGPAQAGEEERESCPTSSICR